MADADAAIRGVHEVAAVTGAVHPSGVDGLRCALALSDVLAAGPKHNALSAHTIAKAAAVLGAVAEVSVSAHVLRVEARGESHLRVAIQRRDALTGSFGVCESALFAFGGGLARWVGRVRWAGVHARRRTGVHAR